MKKIDRFWLIKFKQKEELVTDCYSDAEIRYCKFTL